MKLQHFVSLQIFVIEHNLNMNTASSKSPGMSSSSSTDMTDGTRHTEGTDTSGNSTEKKSNTGASGGASGGDDTNSQESLFECNICLDTARDAVVSRCGHLFCWPCLHQWLETRPNRQVCPVCKAGISKDNVIPLYGRGSTNQQDPREKVPPRPPGERPEPENQGPFQGFGFDGGFQMSFGIGAFPFGVFASAFNVGDGRFLGHPPRPQTPQNPEEQFLSKVFLWVAFLFMLWLLVA